VKKLVIIGAGGHCRAVISTVMRQQKWNIQGIIDLDYHQQKEEILGVSVVGGVEYVLSLDCKEVCLIIAVGDNNQRRGLMQEMDERGFELPNIIDPSAYISQNLNIGKGNYIASMAHIGPCVTIGNGNIINTHANIEHEAAVGNYNNIAPSAVLCGRSFVEDQVLVGANATILDNKYIVKDTVIGAGSVITQNIEKEGRVVVGVPGREV